MSSQIKFSLPWLYSSDLKNENLIYDYTEDNFMALLKYTKDDLTKPNHLY